MKIRIKAEDIIVRNPVAAEMATGKFRRQIIRDKTKYTRKAKHRKGDW